MLLQTRAVAAARLKFRTRSKFSQAVFASNSNDIQNFKPDVNPISDLEIIETEMKRADLE